MSATSEAVSKLLHFLMVYCFVQAVLGRQIKRLAGRIAMIGEPKTDGCYRPANYTEGDWMQ